MDGNDVKLKKPFFVFNPKSYLYGEDLLALAKLADDTAQRHQDEISVFVTAPFSDLSSIAAKTRSIIVTAQHMDSIRVGRGMGHVVPEAVYHAGARACFLNHAEYPLTLTKLIRAVKRAKEMNMITIVCADSLEEAEVIVKLNPQILLCEPTELIGTGKTSDASYIEMTNHAIRRVSKDILVMQAAGISTAEDVYRTITLGADGTGCTSGIVNAQNPGKMMVDMIEACIRAFKERR